MHGQGEYMIFFLEHNIVMMLLRYVLECPMCGVIYRSRQYWYGNPDHEGRITRSKIIHLWPGVCSLGSHDEMIS